MTKNNNIFDLPIGPDDENIYYDLSLTDPSIITAGTPAKANDKQTSSIQPPASIRIEAGSGWLRNAPKQAPTDPAKNKARVTEARSTSKQPRNDGTISYARLREIIAEIKAGREHEL